MGATSLPPKPMAEIEARMCFTVVIDTWYFRCEKSEAADIAGLRFSELCVAAQERIEGPAHIINGRYVAVGRSVFGLKNYRVTAVFATAAYSL